MLSHFRLKLSDSYYFRRIVLTPCFWHRSLIASDIRCHTFHLVNKILRPIFRFTNYTNFNHLFQNYSASRISFTIIQILVEVAKK